MDRTWPKFMDEYNRYISMAVAGPFFGVADGNKVGFLRFVCAYCLVSSLELKASVIKNLNYLCSPTQSRYLS